MSLRIIELRAENVKRLKVAEVRPSTDVIEITGPNGSGKSAVLDSIWMCLAGKAAVPDEPVRKGREKASVKIDIGRYVVERSFDLTRKSSTTSITVRPRLEDGQVGKPLPSPQEILDDLLATLAFDPLRFARANEAEQYQMLKAVVKPAVDIEALQASYDADYTARGKVNAEAKQKRAVAGAIKFTAGLPEQPIDEAAILRELTDIVKQGAAYQAAVAKRENMQRQVADHKSEADRVLLRNKELEADTLRKIEAHQQAIERLKRDSLAEIQTNQETAATFKSRADAIAAAIPAEPVPPPDPSVLERRYQDAQTINIQIVSRERFKAVSAEASALEKQAEDLTSKMDETLAQIKEAVVHTPMPFPGLTMQPRGKVFYDGLPFSQASDAERLRVSIAIAMAEDADLRVIRVKDGGLLDSKSMRLLVEMAKDKDYQVWIEKVDESGKVGIVMEDGTVKANNYQLTLEGE